MGLPPARWLRYVINISGTAGLRGGGSPAYGSAKFGMTGLNGAIAQAERTRHTLDNPLSGGMDTGWRGAPIGVLPRSESMDPNIVAKMIVQMALSPPEFVVNEAVLNRSIIPLCKAGKWHTTLKTDHWSIIIPCKPARLYG